MEKLEWCGYPMVKNVDDVFIRFDTTHERDRHTERQTPHDGIGRAYASHRAVMMSNQDVQLTVPLLIDSVICSRAT